MKNALLILLLLTSYNSFSQIICPEDLTINCDQDYTDLSLIGSPTTSDSLELDDPSVSFLPQINACGVGSVLTTFSSSGNTICTQTITIVNPFPTFDPSTIVMPGDTTITDCSPTDIFMPSWVGGPCDFIGYTADIDTLIFNDLGEFRIVKTYTVIDWCLYDATNGAEGLYTGSQTITVIDEVAPTPYCLASIGYNAADLPLILEAITFDIDGFDDCTPKDKLRFTFSDVLPQFDPTYNLATRTGLIEITADDFAAGELTLDVYSWDLAGNYDYCTVSIMLLTSTDDLDENAITISSNHPNPFKEITTIEFDLVESADVSITVYDISGKEYFTISEYFTVGSHSKSIDLSDAPDGTLLYRLTTKESSVAGKMIKM